MRRMRWASIVVAGTLASVPGSALGYKLIYPPGHAGADEYAEVIPTSAGNVAPPSAGGANPTSAAARGAISHIGEGGVATRKLSHLGKDGQAAATLAAATAPAAVPGETRPERPALGAGGSNHVSAPAGGSVASGISHALGGSGGLGWLFPVLLIASLLAALGIGVAQLRRQPTSG